jgi:hypothetical protein
MAETMGLPPPFFVWQCVLSDAVAPYLDEFIRCGRSMGVRRFSFGNLISNGPLKEKNNPIYLQHPAKMELPELIAFAHKFGNLLKELEQDKFQFEVQPGIVEGIEAALHSQGWQGELPHIPDIAGKGSFITKASTEHLVNPLQTSVNPQAEVGETRDCVDPWIEPYVLEDGNVWPCSWFYGGSIGNIQKHCFRDIWDGDEVKQLRRRLLTGDLAPQCRDCPSRSKTTPAALLAKVRAIPRVSQSQ